MRNFRRDFAEQVARWDRPTQLSLGVSMLMLLLMLLLMQFGPEAWRTWAGWGVGVAILAVQGVILWGNRHMVAPVTQAQRHYLAGEFDRATQILEQECENPNVDAKALTLLGNTYRQMGRLSESEKVLSEAVNISPDWHFPLYGFGRTLLVCAEYARALDALHSALDKGAPSIVWLDVAEANYRLQRYDAMRDALAHVPDELAELHRVWVRDYLLWRAELVAELAPDVAESVVSYWQEKAQRFAGTPYADALHEDLERLR